MYKFRPLTFTLTFIFLCSTFLALAQEGPDTKNKFYFFKVWGFLKYNHPVLTSGKVDADSLFLAKLKDIDAAKTHKGMESVIVKLLRSLNTTHAYKIAVVDDGDKELLKNIDYRWYTSDSFFSAGLRKQLQQIYGHRSTSPDHYYYLKRNFDVELPHERAYSFPDTAGLPYEFRMLSLAKIQATVDYIFPHKYLMDKNWDVLIQASIPKLKHAQSRLAYEKELLLLTANLNDSHAFGFYKSMKNWRQILKVKYFPPFDYVLVNNGKQVLVTQIILPGLCSAAGIRKGDLITRINDLGVEERVKQLSLYLSTSNYSALHRRLSRYLDNLLFITDSLHTNLTFERDGETQLTRIEWASKQEDFKTLTTYVNQQMADKVKGLDLENIAPEVALFRAGETSRFLDKLPDDKLYSGMDSLFILAGKKKGIIFDMRKYPDWGGFFTLLYNKFGQDKIPFAQYFALNKQKIGTFNLLTADSVYYPPFAKPGLSHYAGKVVILVDGNTQSAGEHNTMLLQHIFPQSITIGEQSAGADGDVVKLMLPGGYPLEYSGNAIFYPDGTPVQRKGVKINKIVHPAIKDLIQNEDTLVKEALNMIEGDQ
jgi:C-terminal processing protease CtpA/Prc